MTISILIKDLFFPLHPQQRIELCLGERCGGWTAGWGSPNFQTSCHSSTPTPDNGFSNVTDAAEGQQEGRYLSLSWLEWLQSFVFLLLLFSHHVYGRQCALGDFLWGHMSELFRGFFLLSALSTLSYVPLKRAHPLATCCQSPARSRCTSWLGLWLTVQTQLFSSLQ